MTLTAPEREHLRREIDRRKRARMRSRISDDRFVSCPEAASLLGIKATILRQCVRDLGIETKQRASVMLIPVSELDRLRELRD